MTIENRDRLISIFDECFPKAFNLPKGKFIYFGTGGAIEKNSNFEDIFKGK